ncbi:ankyrin repeat domain-containing protein 2A-like isoform X2 [Papaver somniferum]|uniref:ankyrin repeat domain-containing protein 2A-like isoform X2 n=1 Tax=Papaver somniferum TaxID=3469 RepID=UPI000E702E3E|nr:ankyrin repeat domain-containing protein 2A-like isoform X2 [Papaver somniferum]
MIKLTRVSGKDGSAKEEFLNVHNYVRIDSPEDLKRALAAGADKEDKDSIGRTPLHNACSLGKVKCAQVLLEAGAAVDALDISKSTALHYAVGCGYQECVQLLLDNAISKTRKARQHSMLPSSSTARRS